MTIEGAVTFFIAILIFGLTPGPGVFAILAKGLVAGARSCFPLALGMAISDIVYLILACFGLAVIAQSWGEVFTVIRIAGAMYLIYLGYKMWRAPIAIDVTTPDTSSITKRVSAGFVQGFLISASNPKVILFYIAFLPTFMDLTALNAYDIVLASLLTLIGLMVGLMTIAMGAVKARTYFKSPKAVQQLNRSAGSIMIGAGIFLAKGND